MAIPYAYQNCNATKYYFDNSWKFVPELDVSCPAMIYWINIQIQLDKTFREQQRPRSVVEPCNAQNLADRSYFNH